MASIFRMHFVHGCQSLSIVHGAAGSYFGYSGFAGAAFDASCCQPCARQLCVQFDDADVRYRNESRVDRIPQAWRYTTLRSKPPRGEGKPFPYHTSVAKEKAYLYL
jgi:hypothetical protein